MAMSNRDLGKYKRPGIFINEIDQSIITAPIQELLINLVPGFSKKGPFNCPIRVDSPQEFETIYGSLDKNLENKGSYFHRTVLDMLQRGPVWALNLLKTDPNRDLLEWESVSVAAQYNNGPKNTAPYERFYNRQDFWERDVESFMDVVDEEHSNNMNQPDPANDLLSLTNMGDKKITVFTFKSSITGFDISAESWYGGADKVPLFMKDAKTGRAMSWISDYMISVLSVVGDWTDYSTLSVDPYWNVYFNVNGLIKSKIQDFVNDRLVNVNAYYDVSLIPGFKDNAGLDMSIKNVINAKTDTTGLFCYYNESALLEADFYKGAIDILGQTLVCTEDIYNDVNCKKSIDFMSYNTNVSEVMSYTEKGLDSLSNPFGNYVANMTSNFSDTRTAQYTNWYTNVAPTGTSQMYTSLITGVNTSGITLSATTVMASLSVGDVIYFNKSNGVIDSSTPYYIKTKDDSTFYITISTTKGGLTLGGLTLVSNWFIYSLKQNFSDTTIGFTYILNGIEYNLTGSSFYSSGDTAYTLFLDPLVIANSATTYSRIDVVYLSTDSSKIWSVKGTQVASSSPSKPNFLLNSNNTIILGYYTLGYSLVGSVTPTLTKTWTSVTVNENTGYKVLAQNNDVYALSGTTTDGIKYLDLYFVGTSGATSYSDYDKLRKSKIFSEIYTNLISNKSVIIAYTGDTSTAGYKYQIISPTIYDATTTSDAHIVIYFDTTSNPFDYYSNGKFLIYYIDYEFVMTGTGNISSIATRDSYLSVYPTIGIVAKWSELYQDYYNGYINDGDYFYPNNDTGRTDKIYLKMWLDTNEDLVIKFSSMQNDPAGSDYINIVDWDTNYPDGLIIYSDKTNYKQTLELENTSYITDFNNVNYVYVNYDRYPEIQKGLFLEAYYDVDYYTTGEGYINGAYPAKYVRITKVIRDTVDPTLKVIYTDGPIRISKNVTGTTIDYYTTSYMSIDNYVTEYNGITLNPFIIHPDSIPNNTDARLDTIMSVIDKTTNLAKGLANKNRITWRYLVDSFGLGLTSNSKQEYVDLCGSKLNCFAFINMPSVRQFKTSQNPSFINDDRTINTAYIKDGGDLTKNPTFLYSFGDGVGMSTAGYFFPYVKDASDTSKYVPPASKAAMAYMNKFTGGLGAAYPWQIIAGPQFSKMKNVSGTEMRFTNEDLENLYAMGANPFVYTLNRGYNINSESTAQVFPLSSLSYIHSREVLIELENRLYDMLLNYHWRFNTPEIRAEIKFRADQICKELLDTNALYDFKNICDKTNNTDYIIDLQMGVLDTYIEIIKGMGIIVNNITILKKGDIQSGGFLPA